MKTRMYIEIEFEIDFEYQAFERATLEYPGAQESVEINTIKPVDLPRDLKEYEDTILSNCLEEYRDSHRGRDER